MHWDVVVTSIELAIQLKFSITCSDALHFSFTIHRLELWGSTIRFLKFVEDGITFRFQCSFALQ